ncbi:MAG: hypothetical protein WB870_09510 [Gallionellaceae bacterium]
MKESTKALLCLIAIAILVAVAQTMDYSDQVRMEAEQKAEMKAQQAQRRADFMAWRNAMAATGERK